MLDDLRRHEPAQLSVRTPAQVPEGIAFRHVQAGLPAAHDHLVVEVHASAAHAAFGQQLQELASAAADVEHLLPAREETDVVFPAARG
ncbi:MAG: hypothetical protein R2712_18745 [Vicinamibacterales bacterium]